MDSQRLARWLDRLIEGALLALLVFAPLAFGSVEIWAREVLRIGGLLLGLLVLARVAVAGSPERARTRLWVPILLFALLVGATVLPLPRGLIGAVSPRADRLYEQTVPGYAAGGVVDREAWLAGTLAGEVSGEGEVPAAAESSSLSEPGARTLSVYRGATFSEGLLLVSHLIVFWVAFRFLDRRAVRRVAWAIAVVAMVIAFLGLIQALSGSKLLYFVREAGPGARPMGPFVNRNHFAGYLELAIPVILGLLLGLLRRGLGPSGRGSSVRRSEAAPSLAQAGLLGLMLAVCLAALVLSFSRGGLLATIVVLVAFVVAMLQTRAHAAERWAAILLIGGVLVAGTILAVPLARGQGAEYQAFASPGAEPSWVGRLEAWRGTWEMFTAYPAVGSGLGTFRHAYGPFSPPGSSVRWFQAHNDYLQYLAETGLAGLILLLLGVWMYLRLTLRGGEKLTSEDEALRLGLLLAVLALAVHSLVDFNLQIPSNGVTFAALAGLGAALASARQEPPPARAAAPARGPRLLAALAGLLILLLAIPLTLRAAASIGADGEVSRGIVAMEAGTWAEAVDHFDAACRRDGAPAAQWQAASESRVMLFDALQAAGEEEGLARIAQEAVDRAFEAVGRNPGSVAGWLAMTDAFFRRSQTRPRGPVDLDALIAGGSPSLPVDAPLIRAAARRAVLVDPRSPAALAQSGYVEEVLGETQAAARFYREALRADPLPREHFFLTGLAPPDWVVDAAKAGAADALAEGTLVPVDTVHLRWAEYLKSLGRLEEARVEYLAAARSAVIPERKARFLSLGGLAAFRLGDRVAAREALEAAYEQGRDRDGPLLEALGRIRAEAGEIEGAVDVLGRAMALRPRASTALLLARLEAELGRVERALGTLRRGLSIAPESEALHEALVKLLRESGREITAQALERERRTREVSEEEDDSPRGGTP